MPEASDAVLLWWNSLILVTVLNICLLFFSYKMLRKKIPDMTAKLLSIRKWQFMLSAVYVLGCGFRSIFPRGDLRRIVMVDSWISCIAIGRSVATIAELCFVLQWSLILHEIAIHTKQKTILALSKTIFPIIFIAEIFSWYACLTSNYIGTTIEESLWAIAAAITVWGLFLARPYYKDIQRKFITTGILFGILYIVYMLTVDVPTYFTNWMAAEASGKDYASLSQGFHEVTRLWYPTRKFQDWEYEMVWMSLYFSVAVWISMYIINAPFLDQNLSHNFKRNTSS